MIRRLSFLTLALFAAAATAFAQPAQSPLFREDTLVADLTLGDGRGTFYTRWGDWLPYLCLATMLGLAIRGRRRANRASPR